MQIKAIRGISILAIVIVAIALYQIYPYLLFKVMEWQRAFNLELSASLKAIAQNSTQAGISLIIVSFLYGVFHAVGPGHGKFILTSYLSLEQTKLPQAMKITLLSALVQGFVAIGLVTVIVVIFTLSRSYFNLTLKWVERGSFVIMVLFGLYWCYQAFKHLKAKPKKFMVKSIQVVQPKSPLMMPQQHVHSENCGCGRHKHMPSANEMATAKDWKTTAMLIFSIGLRPCSGAILVLFLAYTLDLYVWGVASTLAMAIGTGLTLTLFAMIVLFARQKAINASRWYLSLNTSKRLVIGLKLLIGLLLIGFGVMLFHSSLLDSSTNLLFKR
ncbi:cobalt transporter [Pasteurellaceae bacterium 15-036681]|nr:cobalt transporter [Pasteurellaceae bacterium 15-036681]